MKKETRNTDGDIGGIIVMIVIGLIVVLMGIGLVHEMLSGSFMGWILIGVVVIVTIGIISNRNN